MKIGFIGAGKVGFSLGKYFVENQITVTGFYSRSPESSQEAATFTNTKMYPSIESILQDSDTLFLTVPDGQIKEVWAYIENLDVKNKKICHCSGSISSTTFFNAENKGAEVYSVHPLYAVGDKYNSWETMKGAYFTVEGTKKGIDDMKSLLEGCGNKVVLMDASKKVLYHSGAVVASNLVIGLFSLSAGLLEQCGFTREDAYAALTPLFLGNAQALAGNGPANALTGPVERNDISTVKNHLSAFAQLKSEADAYSDLGNFFCSVEVVYRQLSRELIEIAKIKHPERDYRELVEVLNNEEHSSHF